MKSVLRLSSSVLVIVVVGLTASLLIDALVLDSPRLTSDMFSPSTTSACKRFKQGMTQSEVLSWIDDEFSPRSEVLGQGYVSFVGIDGDSCVVEFDLSTSRVVSVHFERRPPESSWGFVQKKLPTKP